MGNEGSTIANYPLIGIFKGDFKHRYDIIRRLGEGHHGAAYLVKRKSDGEEVVAKVSHDKSSQGKRGFLEEFTNMRKFHHPNIIKVLEMVEASKQTSKGIWESQSFMIMEFAAGGNLYSYVQKRVDSGQSLSEEWVAGVFAGAMRGICYLHDQGFIHNDVKPDNILVMKTFSLLDKNAIPEVVIADFGSVTSVLDGDVSVADPRYRSPETWRALDVLSSDAFPTPLTRKVDIWAMGSVLFELMSGGKIPFLYKPCSFNVVRESSRFRDIIKKGVLSKAQIVVRAHCQDASYQLENLLKRLLAKDVGRRPTATEVLQDEWLQVKGHTISATVTKQLAFWDLKSRAHAILLNALAIRLTRNYTDECRNIFQSVDLNGDGSIDIDEFKAACKQLIHAEGVTSTDVGIKLLLPSAIAYDDATAESVFKNADINEDDVIDFTEFLTITFDWRHFERSSLDKTLALLVDFLDVDKDGKISMDDAQVIFGEFEDTLPREEFDEVFGQIDLSKDGFISTQELKTFLFGEDVPDHVVARCYTPQRLRRGYQRFFGEDDLALSTPECGKRQAGEDVGGESKRGRVAMS